MRRAIFCNMVLKTGALGNAVYRKYNLLYAAIFSVIVAKNLCNWCILHRIIAQIKTGVSF